ncbi:uncharacterized protein LOC121188158 [Toxotes jaculatrix]|uniref:uncharacterized protein LOC121188158 n=1 Tax=Toxotes jaculatrix TaxID=941984 RepID=UPI001B3B066A|nr:uncharacterized protein LOC121188158 [Toxotes jaculatrix]
MIVLWVTLLVLHHGYSLVPVITVHVGEPVTFTCVLPSELFSSREIFWYKQNAGDTLKVMAMKRKTTNIEFVPEFSESRLKVNNAENCSNLTILSTIPEDEGMYHCELKEWINTKWSGTYLLVKGNSQRTSNYAVVQAVSGPVRPGDSVTLQCSVFSGPENKTCPGVHSVYWFRAGAEKSHPGMIYTDRNRSDECEKKPDAHSPEKSCVYRFTKSVSSSDAGTFYCAVATCGQILFGNGTKLQMVQTTHKVHFIALGILTVCLAISVFGNVVLIRNRRVHEQYKGTESAISEARNDNSHRQVHDITEDENQMNYAALNFSERKATRVRKKNEIAEESLYSQVKC